jgi:hypothetical protein
MACKHIDLNFRAICYSERSVEYLQEVPPLDLTEILAYLVRQSGPFLDQLGIRRGIKHHCRFALFGFFVPAVLTILALLVSGEGL